MAAPQLYEFVEGDEKIEAPGVVARRIRALTAVAATLRSPAVAPGDLGGYIQAIDNLNAEVSGDAWVYGDAWVEKPWQFLAVGTIGSENVTATLVRTKTNKHMLTVGCWTGTLGTLMAEVERRRDNWTADEATQAVWMGQYKALKALGKATVARWEDPQVKP